MEKLYNLNQLVYAKINGKDKVLEKHYNYYQTVTNYKDGIKTYIAEDVEEISSFLKYLYDNGVMMNVIKNGKVKEKLDIHEIYKSLNLALISESISKDNSDFINNIGMKVFIYCFYHIYKNLDKKDQKKLILLSNSLEKIIKDMVKCDLLSDRYNLIYEISKKDKFMNRNLKSILEMLDIQESKIGNFRILYSNNGVECYCNEENCYNSEKKYNEKNLLDNERIKRYTM